MSGASFRVCRWSLSGGPEKLMITEVKALDPNGTGVDMMVAP